MAKKFLMRAACAGAFTAALFVAPLFAFADEGHVGAAVATSEESQVALVAGGVEAASATQAADATGATGATGATDGSAEDAANDEGGAAESAAAVAEGEGAAATNGAAGAGQAASQSGQQAAEGGNVALLAGSDAGTSDKKDDSSNTGDTNKGFTGEKCDGKYWYYYKNGKMVKNDFVLIKDATNARGAKWCYYDSKGHMLYGEQYINNSWYLFNKTTGAVTYDFQLISDGNGGKKWVYYDTITGIMAHGEGYVNGGWYLFNEWTGAVTYGFQLIGDGNGGLKWVYYDTITGIMYHGEACVDNGWYYFNKDTGAVTYGFKTLKDSSQPSGKKKVYYDTTTGRMQYGEQCIKNAWYQFNSVTGAMVYGWSKSGLKVVVYYDTSTGKMAHGEAYVPGDSTHTAGWYYFDDISGKQIIGLKWVSSNGGKLVYYNKDTGGAMAHGWLKTAWGANIHWDETTGALRNKVTKLDMNVTATSFAKTVSTKYDAVATEGASSTYAYGTNLLVYADLRRSSANTVTAAQLNAFISSTSTGQKGTLKGHGQDIIDAANKYNIDAVYLMAHAILESGWGTSKLAAGNHWDAHTFDGKKYKAGNYYNFFGYGAYDSDPYNGGMNYAQIHGWNSVRNALVGGAQSISENYIHSTRTMAAGMGDYSQHTLYTMRFDPLYYKLNNKTPWHMYASGQSWATSIARIMSNFYSYSNVTPSYSYEFPVYVNGGGYYG